jgi:hypothetical protein
MDFFRKLFGGAATGGDSDKSGLYFYVRARNCDEVVQVRIDTNNDLSLSDDGSGYWVRKLAHGSNYRCRWPVEMTLYFDSNRKLQNSDVQGGELVTREEYEAWVAQKS